MGFLQAQLEDIGGTMRVRLKADTTHVHSNLVPCIVFGRDCKVSVESQHGVVSGAAILVDANWDHVVNFHGGAVDVIYLEPRLRGEETGFGAILVSKSALRILEDNGECWSSDSASALLDVFGGPKPTSDVGISEIQRRIAADPMIRLSETEASQMAKLERTTMLRRFKRQTGMTFRAYKNWTALKHATRLMVGGEQIGCAGLDAGFADAAHFSRQFRSTFGLSPTEARNSVISSSAHQ
jgi:AraC-like DNA-binding protein